ncbi:sensor histidine kinase [Streptomyces sp. NPDC060194]|uniref:sensor histidine kinase n=1 Tax=Streptomyces sp. NPDC060194 TaxID=3347069 RepID=UPI00365D86E0
MHLAPAGPSPHVHASRPHRDDVMVAVFGLVSGVVLWGLGLDNGLWRDLGPRWLGLLPLAAMSALSLLRRLRPLTALAAGVPVLVADQLVLGSIATVGLFSDLIYAAVLYGPPWAPHRIPVACAIVSLAATGIALAVLRDAGGLLVGLVVALVTLVSAWTGVSVRTHRDAAEAATLRAQQTALLAEMDRVGAVVAERARMARELHDLVANHLSAIAVHSTAALSLDDERTSRDALGVIRENSVQGLAEMRRLIGILRDAQADPDGEPAAAPTLGGLPALVARARTNGLDAVLRMPDPDTGFDTGHPLPAPAELAAYRIVQESLTNALKHAGPGPVSVVLGRSPTALTVEVTSLLGGDGGNGDGPRAPGSGAGLVGMRERVALLGGVFAAGPESRPDGGRMWRVRAELPVEEGGSPS